MQFRSPIYPDRPIEDILGIVEQTIRKAGDDWLRHNRPKVSNDGFQTAGSIAPDAPSVTLVGEHHRRVTGHAMRPLVGTSVNDMRSYNFAGTPAGCYGATGGNGHAADEWLDLTSLTPAAKVLGGFIVDWCGFAI